jgi:hypothetical protein
MPAARRRAEMYVEEPGVIFSCQTAEKRPSAAFLSSFVVAEYIQYTSLLRISRALHLGIFERPLGNNLFNNFSCLLPPTW